MGLYNYDRVRRGVRGKMHKVDWEPLRRLSRRIAGAKQSSITPSGFTNLCIIYTPGCTGGYKWFNPSGLAKSRVLR